MAKKRVVIIGGGVAGLAAAYTVEMSRRTGEDVEYRLLEKDDRLGGKVWTKRRDGWLIDGGPDCFLSEKPWVAELAGKVGVDDRIIPSNDEHKKTFILAGGAFHLLPDGVLMMVPTKFMPFVTSGLFTWRGKIRMGLELLVPTKRDGSDESLAHFVRRRLGREALDRLAEPLVAGIHASDPDTMSLAATFPRFLDMEQKYGSLIKGFLKARKAAPAWRPSVDTKPGSGAAPGSAGAAPASTGAAKRTFFMSFHDGMGELTERVAGELLEECVRVGVTVESVEAARGGEAHPTYRIALTGGEAIEADAVIVTAEAHAAAEMVHALDPEMAGPLAEIPWTSSAIVSLGFRRSEIKHGLDGFGFVVPSAENRRIMASTWSSTKWSNRAPEGHVLVRAFVGGAKNEPLADLEDGVMIDAVRGELKDLMGIDADPVLAEIFRWKKGMPQYTLGHLDRLKAIDERLAMNPGFYLAGGSYRGVGLGDCINGGSKAATAALEHIA